MERPATATSYIASGGAVLSGLTANEIGIYGGLIVAALTFLVNAYYRHKTFAIMEQVAKEKPDCAVCPERKIDA